MYLHSPVLEVGSWWRVDTASGTNTPTTVYVHDGADAIPTALGASGSTVRGNTRDGTGLFWSSAATLYCKELTYQGVPTGTVVTSTGVTPTTPSGAPVDIATISKLVAALPTTYVQLLVTDATSTTLTGTLTAGHLSPVDCTAGAGARTLPAAASVAAGTPAVAKKADSSANSLVVSRAGSDLIFGTGAGATSKTLTLSGEAVTFVSNGVDRWSIESSDTPSGAIAATYAPIAATPVASSATSGTLTAAAEHNLSPTSAAAWTLPTSVTATRLPTTVKNNGTATITVARGGSDTINGGTASVSIAAGEWARFTSDGSGAWTQSGTAGQSATYVQKVAAPTGVAATDTAAIQAAHDALASARGMLVLQPGTYDISSGLTFSKQVKVVGAGAGNQTSACTKLVYTGATGDAITVSAHGCAFEDFAVVNTSGSAPTAGTGIRFSAGIRTRLTRVTVAAFFNCVRFDDGCYQKLTDCDFVDAVNYCLYLSNPNATDNGDNIIHGCQLGGYALNRIPVAAVYWESGGGLHFTGNKINCAQTYIAGVHTSIGTGILMKVADGVSTSVVVIHGNSIEGWNSAAIDVKQSGVSNTGSVGKIVISGNELAGNSGTAIAVHPAAATNFREVIITDNSIGNCSSSILLANLTAAKIGMNVHKAVTGTIVSSDSTVTDLHIEPQVVSGDSITLYTEAGADTSSVGPFAQASWPLSREIGNVSSNSVYTVMYRITMPSFSAGKFNVTFAGNLNGVGAFYYDNVVTYTRGNGGAVTATAGTATTSGGVVDVQFDTATVSGEIQIGIKRNTTNGTAIKGRCHVVLVGHPSNIKKGA